MVISVVHMLDTSQPRVQAKPRRREKPFFLRTPPARGESFSTGQPHLPSVQQALSKQEKENSAVCRNWLTIPTSQRHCLQAGRDAHSIASLVKMLPTARELPFSIESAGCRQREYATTH